MNTISIQNIGITKLTTDAIVNAANEGLWEGGGVCGAIFREAGSRELTQACNKIGHCVTGNAVITPAFNLKAKYIIHAVGPRWIDGKHNEPSLLYDAYKNSLLVAKANDIHSIGFPLISAGIFSYPVKDAWKRAIAACNNFISKNPEYDIDIIFAVLDDEILKIGQKILNEVNTETKISVTNSKPETLYEKYSEEIKPGRYRHYKGNEYEVIGIAHHSETEEIMVVYRALYAKKELWVRPAKMWNEIIDVDGKQVRRFEYIESKYD